MAYTVELNSAAKRDYLNLDLLIRARVSEVIDGLENNPRPSGCLKLSGKEKEYRVRIAAYRIIYTIDDRTRLVSVKKDSASARGLSMTAR